jgi:3-phenylpropionate/cinnamic acid dioxygenase small subunit
MDAATRETVSEQETMRQLIDHETISDLIHRLGTVLDERRFEDLALVFAEDGAITTPGGHAEGLDAIVAQAARNHTPELHTQHFATDLVVDLDGDRARARANYVAVFAVGSGDPAPAPQFQIGSVYRFDLVRTGDGWRLHSMEVFPTWAAGERP